MFMGGIKVAINCHNDDLGAMQHTITLDTSARQFVVDREETILHAARLQNIPLSYSCLNGTCGSCKATLLEGEIAYPFKAPEGLSEEERASGCILLCQAVARSDLRLIAREVPAVAGIPLRQLAVRIASKERLTQDVVRVFLKLPKSERLQFLPGQYLDIIAAGGKRRAFSIANAPHESESIELHLRYLPTGGFAHWLFHDMPDNALLRVEGPLGTFVPRDESTRPALFVAGGTGFAPIKGLLAHFLLKPATRTLKLYWGARSETDLYLRSVPAKWAEQFAHFSFEAIFSEGDDARGFVHEAVIRDHPDLAAFDVYMAGPPLMIESARRAFLLHGLPEAQLYYDSFDYPPDPRTAQLTTA